MRKSERAVAEAGAPRFTAGQVAKVLGVSTSALRHWERKGLIDRPDTTWCSVRQYTEAEVEAIKKFVARRKVERVVEMRKLHRTGLARKRKKGKKK